VTEDCLFAAGMRKSPNLNGFLPYLYAIQLDESSDTTILATRQISSFNFGSKSFSPNHYSSMSLSVHTNEQIILVGIPHLNFAAIFYFNKTNNEFELVYEHHFGHTRTFCGQSVTWIDDDKYAILCLSLSTLPWSISQVQVSANTLLCEIFKV
jgi:hypothetical protein